MEARVLIDPDFAISVPDAAGHSELISCADLFSPDVDLANVELVIAPLIGAGFDAIELIVRLGNAGFRGRLHVRSEELPDSQLVIGELRAAAKPFGFSVDLANTD